MKNSITVLSPAKINLGLDIKERLPNGYHDVRMVMQSLDLCDTVHVHRVAYSNPEDRITCSSPGTDLPTDKSNLALRAFTMLFDEFELEGGMHIILDKKIPLAAGLAGGSGDAAAVLTAVNELFELGLSDEELCARGVQIGADVPFCIMRGTMLAEGIGEKLTRLPSLWGDCVLLVKPDINVSSKWAYETWDHVEEKYHPDIDGMIEHLPDVAPFVGNSFEPIIAGRYPIVRKIKEDMLRYGALGAAMTGSGPTVFGLFEDDIAMHYAAETMRRLYPDTFVSETHFVAETHMKTSL